jgi:protein TonB
VHSGIRAPKRLAAPQPEYPPVARAARVEGTVILEAVIDETGAVRDVKVLRSIPLLDRAAVAAVSRWQYEPTRLNGQPVAIVMTVTVTFRLNEPGVAR